MSPLSLGSHGHKSITVRLTSWLAILTLLVGSLRMAYAAPREPSKASKLSTDTPWALDTRQTPTRLTVLEGGVEGRPEHVIFYATSNRRHLMPREMLPLALSYDHRVIDGANGARFLRFVAEALEQPMSLYV